YAAEQIGVSAAVRGNVELIQQGQTPRKASSGIPVYFEEKIISAADSGMQLMLLDKTTFTVGPDSEIVIDDMVYDPSGESSLAVSVAKGAFRYLSGEIGKKNPQNVRINTPTGEIGIRGTNLFATQTNGKWFFGLLGPGPNNNTGDKPGGFVFKNNQGEAKVTRPGYGFAVDVGGAPGTVGPIPPEVFAKFSEALAKQEEKNGDGDAKTEAKTESSSDGKSSLASTEEASGQKQAVTQAVAITQQITQAVQNEVMAISTAVATAESMSFKLLTYDEVRAYSGSANYAVTGAKLYGDPYKCDCSGSINQAQLEAEYAHYNSKSPGSAVGSYDFSVTANFTSRTLTGGWSNINVNGSALGGTSITSENLGLDASTNASGVLDYSSLTGTFDPTTISRQSTADSNYWIEGGMVFLDGGGALKPNLGQGLFIATSGVGDVVGGIELITPK
ncbi:MAG: FecR domain-containing protein, partial [Rhodospirillaceae bacterium]|nr:FecR domain-containing protein [Rhodospirillaceae bacterium]